MSNRYHLTQQELDELEYEHRHTSDKRYADRIKALYLLGSGWPVSQVAQALMMDRESVRNHHKRYRKGGLMTLLRHQAGQSDCWLRLDQARASPRDSQQHRSATAQYQWCHRLQRS